MRITNARVHPLVDGHLDDPYVLPTAGETRLIEEWDGSLALVTVTGVTPDGVGFRYEDGVEHVVSIPHYCGVLDVTPVPSRL